MDQILRERVIRAFERINLTQYPPQARTILFSVDYWRLYFPWTSFGEFSYRVRTDNDWGRERGTGRIATSIVGFLHTRKWENFSDAVDILRHMPGTFHTSSHGIICVGNAAGKQVFRKEITPAAAFWMTRNHQDTLWIHEAMRSLPPDYNWLNKCYPMDWLNFANLNEKNHPPNE